MSRNYERAGSLLSNPLLRRALGIVSVGAVLAASGYVGAKYGLKALSELTTEPSEVVAGTPGLVMAGDARYIYRGGVRYQLLIEQCPQDVEAAKHGNPNSQSYNTNPEVMTEGCYADWVLVGHDTYFEQLDGSYIFFAGQPTEHLRKPRTFGG